MGTTSEIRICEQSRVASSSSLVALRVDDGRMCQLFLRTVGVSLIPLSGTALNITSHRTLANSGRSVSTPIDDDSRCNKSNGRGRERTHTLARASSTAGQTHAPQQGRLGGALQSSVPILTWRTGKSRRMAKEREEIGRRSCGRDVVPPIGPIRGRRRWKDVPPGGPFPSQTPSL